MNGLEIATIWHDESGEEFMVKITNGLHSCKIEMYDSIENILEFAQKLRSFPHNLGDVVTIELGQDCEHLCYLLLEAFCYNQSGHAALRIKAKNNIDIPQKFDFSFYMPCEVAAINNLGKALIEWDFRNEVFEWYPKL